MGRKELRYKIGEIVTINNEKYIVTESKDIYGCTPCDLQDKCYLDPYLYGAGLCTESARPDKKGIIYKRVEYNMKYAVFDGLGNLLRKFKTFQAAMTFKIANNRHDWRIAEL